MSGIDPCTALKQADLAYQKLMMNQSVRVVVDQNGERIEYSSASAVSLLGYIRTLAPQCPSYTPVALGAPVTKPIKFFFG